MTNLLQPASWHQQAKCYYPAFITAVFIVLMLVWLSYFWGQHRPDFAHIYGFGSAEVPTSDARLWCRNALRIFFGMPPETETPRLYMSIMFGSLFALTGSLNTVVVFPGLIILFVLVYTFFIGNSREQILVIGLISVFIVLHNKIFLQLQLGSIMPDFLAFALSLTAILLFWQGCKQNTPNWTAINIALLCLGSVAAIRGLPIVAGLLWIVCLRVWFNAQLTRTKLLSAIVCFLLPPISEGILHQHYGIPSNLFSALWSFTVPPYRWTVESHETIIKLLDVDKSIMINDIYVRYFQFVFSQAGLTTFFTLLIERIRNDVVPATQPLFLLLCMGCYGIHHLTTRLFSQSTHNWVKPSVLAGITLLLVVIEKTTILGNFPRVIPITILVWLCFLLIISVGWRMKLVSISLCLYLGSLVIFVLLGSPGNERTASTYHFTLYLSMIALMFQPESHHNSPEYHSAYKNGLAIVMWLHGILLCFLYFGVYVLPSSLKTSFNDARANHSRVAIKISESPLLDRVLYFNHEGQMFLTQMDTVKQGQIVTFNQLITHPAPDSRVTNPIYSKNDLFYDASLFQPYSFVDGKILSPP